MKIKLISILTILVVVLSGCGADDNKVTLMLDYVPNTNHIGIYTALENGYYEVAGIDLEIIEPAAISVESMVSTNQVEFGVSYQENVMMSRDNEMDVVSVMATTPTNTSEFMVYDSHDLSDGITYCGWGSDVEYAILDFVAEQLDISDITKIVSELGFVTSEETECDVYWEYPAWAGVQASDNGIAYSSYPLTDYGLDFYTPVIITSQSLIDENPQLVNDFIKATQQGYIDAYSDTTAAANTFIKYNPDYTFDFIKKSLEVLKPFFDQTGTIGYQEERVWQEFASFLADNEIISNGDVNGAYSNDFIKS